MRHDPTILAFDTSAAHCAAALLCDGQIVTRIETMAKGQGERLMVMLDEVLAENDTRWSDLDGIGVGVGPGNFTGIRIAVSAARGLALGLGKPAIAVSTFEVQRDPFGLGATAAELVSVEAPRGSAYVQSFRYGCPEGPAEMIDVAAPPEHLRRVNLIVNGYQADQIAAKIGGTCIQFDHPMLIGERIARIAEWKLGQDYDETARPAPMYVKPPDAAPPRERPPVILP